MPRPHFDRADRGHHRPGGEDSVAYLVSPGRGPPGRKGAPRDWSAQGAGHERCIRTGSTGHARRSRGGLPVGLPDRCHGRPTVRARGRPHAPDAERPPRFVARRGGLRRPRGADRNTPSPLHRGSLRAVRPDRPLGDRHRPRARVSMVALHSRRPRRDTDPRSTGGARGNRPPQDRGPRHVRHGCGDRQRGDRQRGDRQRGDRTRRPNLGHPRCHRPEHGTARGTVSESTRQPGHHRAGQGHGHATPPHRRRPRLPEDQCPLAEHHYSGRRRRRPHHRNGCRRDSPAAAAGTTSRSTR